MKEDDWHKKEIVKVHKACEELQKKAGTGSVSQVILQNAEKVIENNTVDFVPMAQGYLEELGEILSGVSPDGDGLNALRKAVIVPIMQLKANGSVFGYPLVSELAAITLSFLEAVRTMDQDVIDILNASYQTLLAVVNQRISGDGGEVGESFRDEMYAVCDRYMKKQSQR